MLKMLLVFAVAAFLASCGGGGSSSGGSSGSQSVDTTPPVITIIGGNETITQSTPYTDPGATALDDRDGAIGVHTTSSVDTNKLGTYTITYTATDSAGNTATATRTIIVVNSPDNFPPQISLIGGDVSIAQGTQYNDAGASAVDNVDLNVNIVVTNTVKINVPGTYTVTYSATDTAGNTATATRTVTVTPKPVDRKAEAINKIMQYADDPTGAQIPNEGDYRNAGVTNVTIENLPEVNDYVASLNSTNVNDSNKIQNTVDKVLDSMSLVSVEPDRTLTNWLVQEVNDFDTGNSFTVLTLPAQSGSMKLRLFCGSPAFETVSTDFQLDWDIWNDATLHVSFLYGYGINDTSQFESWRVFSHPDKSLFIPKSFELVKKLYIHSLMNIFVSGLVETGETGHFNNFGLSVAMDKTRGACGWSEQDFPIKNGWGNTPYPSKPPTDAKESTYSDNLNKFRLIAWVGKNQQGQDQLMVRIGDQLDKCSTITDKRLFVKQGGKNIAVAAYSKINQVCDKPSIYALTGDFNMAEPFDLVEYPLFSGDNPIPITTISFP